VFVDIEPDTYNLDPADIERKVTEFTKGVMVVDVRPSCRVDDRVVAARHGLKLTTIAEAIGGLPRSPGRELQGRRLFRLHPNKQMTTGEGGTIAPTIRELAAARRSMRNQGRSETGLWLSTSDGFQLPHG
jgi:perosamine synthetase